MSLLPSAASAEPATTVGYPGGAAATRYAGLAFDTCTAPSLAAIEGWGASPYRAVGGTYVTDYYVSTPSNTTYSSPLPRCSYPYQVTAAGGLNKRTGPGTSYPAAGTLPNGGLAWVVCQKAGSTVGTTSVWDKLDDARWVTDYYVATPSKTTYSKPIPRC